MDRASRPSPRLLLRPFRPSASGQEPRITTLRHVIARAAAVVAFSLLLCTSVASAQRAIDITPDYIVGIKLGMPQARATALLTKPVRFDRLEEGYQRYVSGKQKVEAYFQKGAPGVVALTTWNRQLKTGQADRPVLDRRGAEARLRREAEAVPAGKADRRLPPREPDLHRRSAAEGRRGRSRADRRCGVHRAERSRLYLGRERGVHGVVHVEVLEQAGDLERAADVGARALRGRGGRSRAACGPRSACRARWSRRSRPRRDRRRRVRGPSRRSPPAPSRPPLRCGGRSRLPIARRRRRSGARRRRPAGA